MPLDPNLTQADLAEYLNIEELERHQQLMELLELARSNTPLTLGQLASLMGVGKERVRQIERSAKHKLRHHILNDDQLFNAITNNQ